MFYNYCQVQFGPRQKKEKRPQQKQVTFIRVKRGDSWPNNQADSREGSRRLHICREACGSDKENVNQAGCFGYFLVEMAFVVGQGVVSLLSRCRGWKVSGQGMISPRQMQLAWSIRAGPKVLFCFLQSQMVQQGPLRLLFSFLGPKDSFRRCAYFYVIDINICYHTIETSTPSTFSLKSIWHSIHVNFDQF